MDTSVLIKCFLLSTWCILQVPCSEADGAYCTKIVSLSKTVYVQVSRTQTIATYYKCWIFWTCTTYRYMTVYSSEARTQTTYATTPVCCEGYTYNNYVCVRTRGLDTNVNVPTKTTLTPTDANRGNDTTLPTENTLSTDQWPGNGTSTTEATIMATTPSTTTSNRLGPTSKTPLSSPPSNGTWFFNKRMNKMPMGAKVLFGILAGVIVVACITVTACLVHRRQKRRFKHNTTDTMHMEPLRDLQVLSERGAAVRVLHFSPHFAPDDEYAVVDKGQDAKELPGSKDQDKPYYENTVIQEDTGNVKGKMKKDKGKIGKSHENSPTDKVTHHIEDKRLTHTYMDGAAFSPAVPEGHEWGRAAPDKTCCKKADADTTNDRHNSGQNVYEAIEEKKKAVLTCDQLETCYTEVDNDVCAFTQNQIDPNEEVYEAIERAKETGLTYDHLDRDDPTSRATSRETEDVAECGEVAGKYGVLAQLSSGDNPNNRQDVYEAIEEPDKTVLTYDHLERDNPTSRQTSKEAEAHESGEELAGKYGVLAHSSSVDNPEHYDQLLRSVSQTTDQPGDNEYGSIDESQTEEQQNAADAKLPSNVPALAYDDIRRGLPSVSGKKASSLAGLLHSATVRAAYGHLGSSMESDPGDPPFNKDHHFSGVAASDRDSTYTDMSGSFRHSTASARSSDNQTYTPMSPFPDTPEGVTYFSVPVGGDEHPHHAAGNSEQCASISERKQNSTYDQVKRKPDGGRPDFSKGITGDDQESRRGKANVDRIYENV